MEKLTDVNEAVAVCKESIYADLITDTFCADMYGLD